MVESNEMVSAVPTEPVDRTPARAWVVFTTVLAAGVFLQAVTAGRILKGDDWARDVHSIAAVVLFVAAIGGGVVALVRLRDRPRGRQFGWILVAIGIGLFVQHGLGLGASDGDDTLWIHVPLGVALFGFLLQASRAARRVGDRA